MRKDMFQHTMLQSAGHKFACKCDECLIVRKNLVWFRQWHEELNGACVVDDTGVCVGCINCALEPRPQREPVPVKCPF